MRGGYLSAAWGDVRNSPNWFGKVVILALIGLIPVFGDIVLFGYLLGWSRDLAWGVRAPLPSKVFRNADGMLYARGLFYLVIAFLFRLPSAGLSVLLSGDSGYASFFGSGLLDGGMPFLSSFGYDSALILLAWLASTAFVWVGAMRMSVYGRLAPGLQVDKIAAMIRYDAGGLVRIMGMVALLAMAAFLVIIVGVVLLFGVSLLVAFLVSGSAAWQGDSGMLNHGAIVVMGFAVSGLAALYAVAGSAATVLIEMLVMRSLAYWLIQFQIPSWGGQDDPMPFQMEAFRPGGRSC